MVARSTNAGGHILYDCPALLEGDPDDEFAALPEQLAEARDRLVKSGIGAGRPEWDYTYPVYGVPELPIGLPPRASVSSEVLYWGNTEGNGDRSRIRTDRGLGQMCQKPGGAAGASASWTPTPSCRSERFFDHCRI